MGIFEENAEAVLGEDNLLQTLEEQAGREAESAEEVLQSLVGEGKKFKSVEALARGKVLSDAFIEKLISEKRQLEKELQEKKRLEDFMTEIKNLTPNRDEPSNGRDITAERTPTSESALDPQALVEQTLRAIEDKNRASLEAQNVQKVKDGLSQAYGPRWLSVLEEFSNKLGMSRETVDLWVKSNPEATIQAVHQFKGANFQAPVVPIGQYTPSTHVPSMPGGLNTYKDFQKIRTSDPARYASREFQVLMHDTAVKRGDAFFT